MAKFKQSSTVFDNGAIDTSGIDDFLASALTNQALATGVTGVPAASQVLQLAEIDPVDVAEVLMIIPAHDDGQKFTVDSDVMSGFRGEIQAWLAMLRQQGLMVTELLPLSVRDQSARKIVSHLLDTAYQSPKKSWMTMLPTGRQLVIAPSHVVNTIGFDGVCRIVHKTAILAAQAAGLRYNDSALSYYQASGPVETQ